MEKNSTAAYKWVPKLNLYSLARLLKLMFLSKLRFWWVWQIYLKHVIYGDSTHRARVDFAKVAKHLGHSSKKNVHYLW